MSGRKTTTMKIFRRGKHRAPRACRDHVRQISRHHAEIEAIERIMRKLSDDRDEVYRENERLRMQAEQMRPHTISEPASEITDVTAMLQSSTVPLIFGPSMLVPAAGPRQRDHRLNWALGDDQDP